MDRNAKTFYLTCFLLQHKQNVKRIYRKGLDIIKRALSFYKSHKQMFNSCLLDSILLLLPFLLVVWEFYFMVLALDLSSHLNMQSHLFYVHIELWKRSFPRFGGLSMQKMRGLLQSTATWCKQRGTKKDRIQRFYEFSWPPWRNRNYLDSSEEGWRLFVSYKREQMCRLPC